MKELPFEQTVRKFGRIGDMGFPPEEVVVEFHQNGRIW